MIAAVPVRGIMISTMVLNISFGMLLKNVSHSIRMPLTIYGFYQGSATILLILCELVVQNPPWDHNFGFKKSWPVTYKWKSSKGGSKTCCYGLATTRGRKRITWMSVFGINVKLRATICACNEGTQERCIIDHLETNVAILTLEEVVAYQIVHKIFDSHLK